MHRLFVAIRPPEHIRDLLIDAMGESADFRWQSDDQLHLTLRFIGDVDRPTAEDVASALSSIHSPRFALRLSGLGSFDHPNGGAIWAGVEPKDHVVGLAARIERACQSAGLAPERRAYHPHITIARWNGRRSREARAFLEGRALTSLPFEVDRFILYESRLTRHGAQYQPAIEVPLAIGG